MSKKRSDQERFWSLVEKRDDHECWIFTGAVLRNGYGTFKAGSRLDGTRRNVGAHRYCCEITKRRMGPGEFALHHCDNKRCVNPSHLYIGSRADNARDASERGLLGRGGRAGSLNSRAKLTEAQVLEIRASTDRNADLARRFGVSNTHIGWIKSGRSWGHLNGADDLRRAASSGGQLA